MPAANVTSPARSGRNQLGALLLLSVTGYVILALWFPLIPNVTVAPPGDVRSFAPGLLGGVAYAVLVIALFGLFLAAVRMAAEKGMGSRPLLTLVGGTLLLAVPLLMTYPVNAIDIFGYVIRGRIASTYGENPFTSPADRFIGDPFMPLVGEWAGEDFPLRVGVFAIAQGHHRLDHVRARGARRAYRAVRRALGEKRYLRRGRLLLHRAAPLSEGRRETC